MTLTRCYGLGQRAGDHVLELGGDLEQQPGWRWARLSTIRALDRRDDQRCESLRPRASE